MAGAGETFGKARDHSTVQAHFAEIYREHSSAVYGLAHRVCGPALAAEVTQDVFVRLWAHPEKFDPTRGSLRSFLLAMTNGRAIDVVRSETSRRGREDRTSRFAPAPDVESDQDLLEQERSATIARAIAELPPNERDAIVSAFYGERTYREAAQVLGVPEGTVKSRIRAGLRSLHAALGDLSSAIPAN